MAQDKDTPGGGTILRGDDGELYFIPQDALEAFRLDDKRSAAVEETIGAVRGRGDSGELLSTLPAPVGRRLGLLASDNEPTQVAVNIGAMRRAL